MATTKIGPLNLRAGLRREEMNTDSLAFDARSIREVTAASFPVAAGRATTIPGTPIPVPFPTPHPSHRQLRQPVSQRLLKYNITRAHRPAVRLQHDGAAPAVRRCLRRLADRRRRTHRPGPQRKPETSKNYSARLARYFEPIGTVAINFFQNDVSNLPRTHSQISGPDFNPGDPTHEGFTFVTTLQSANYVRLRGMELEYDQIFRSCRTLCKASAGAPTTRATTPR